MFKYKLQVFLIKASKISREPALAVTSPEATRASKSLKKSANCGFDRIFWLTVAITSDQSHETACLLRRWLMLSSDRMILWYCFISSHT